MIIKTENLFHEDAIGKGLRLATDEAEAVGSPELAMACRIMATNIVNNHARLNYTTDDSRYRRTVTPQVMAATELVSVGLLLLYAKSNQEVVAMGIKTLSSISQFVGNDKSEEEDIGTRTMEPNDNNRVHLEALKAVADSVDKNGHGQDDHGQEEQHDHGDQEDHRETRLAA